MNFRDYKAQLRKRGIRKRASEDWETNETIDWLINDAGLSQLAYEAVRSGWRNPGDALRELMEEIAPSLEYYKVDLDLVDWDAVAEHFVEDEDEEDGEEDVLGPKSRALLDRDTPRQSPQVQPVVGQVYRVGDLPPGSVVRASTNAEYVVSPSGLAMKWEQPIPGSDNWQVTYVRQLPPGESMTEQEWQEVAQANGSVGEVSPDLFQHPDPWMDSEPGTLTLPEHWGKIRRMASHGLIPCPNCGGDIQHKSGNCQMCGGMGQAPASPGISGKPRYQSQMCPMCQGSGRGESWYQCSGCGKQWDDNNAALQEIMPKGIPCPKCGSEMREQYHSPLYRQGAWECSNQSCWHMMPFEDAVPDTPPADWS